MARWRRYIKCHCKGKAYQQRTTKRTMTGRNECEQHQIFVCATCGKKFSFHILLEKMPTVGTPPATSP